MKTTLPLLPFILFVLAGELKAQTNSGHVTIWGHPTAEDLADMQKRLVETIRDRRNDSVTNAGVMMVSNVLSLPPLSIIDTHSTRTTNWYPSGSSIDLVWTRGFDPNNITNYETGAICSNFVARIQFNGAITNIVLQSSEIGRTSRYYTEKKVTVREYSAPW